MLWSLDCTYDAPILRELEREIREQVIFGTREYRFHFLCAEKSVHRERHRGSSPGSLALEDSGRATKFRLYRRCSF